MGRFLLVVLLGAMTARAASASPALVIDIRDYARVSRSDLDRAIAELTRIFGAAGVSVAPRVRPRPIGNEETVPLSPHSVVVILQSRLAADWIVDDPHVLGAVPGALTGGRIAYVFPSRVDTLARRNRVDYGRLLGIVLAHELGHVLLPAPQHADAGIMRPVCDRHQVRNVMLGVLAFTPRETAIIQAGLF